MFITLYNNKHTIKIIFTTQLFLFTYIPINITEVFSTDVNFLYTINEVHDENMSLPNGIYNNINKR